MTQKKSIPKKTPKRVSSKNVTDRPPPPLKKKVMEENALNALHLKNVTGRPPPPKKKKKEINKLSDTARKTAPQKRKVATQR